jgi:type IV pilus assembly protein PilW
MAQPFRTARRQAQRGLTLVELIVSVGLGILVIGVVVYSYVGAKGTYRAGKSSSRIQEAGHFGLDTMLLDVRNAGFVGCGSRQAVSYNPPGVGQMSIYQIANPPLSVSTTADAMAGYMPSSYQAQGATSGWPVAAQAAPAPWIAGDALTLRIVTGTPVGMAQDPVAGSETMFLNNNCGNLAQGNYLMVSNCTNATILRVSNKPQTGAQACPRTNNGVVPGGVPVQYTNAPNCNNNSVACNTNPTNPSQTPQLSPPSGNLFYAASMTMAQQFDEVTYYVGQVPPVNGIAVRPPALYRYSAAAALADPLHASEEIIDHVENMVVTYGVLVGNGIVCEDAGLVQATNAWGYVRSVRVSIVAVGDEAGMVDNPQSFTLGQCETGAGTGPTTKTIQIPATPGDTRLHQIFTATASLGDKLQ